MSEVILFPAIHPAVSNLDGNKEGVTYRSELIPSVEIMGDLLTITICMETLLHQIIVSDAMTQCPELYAIIKSSRKKIDDAKSALSEALIKYYSF